MCDFVELCVNKGMAGEVFSANSKKKAKNLKNLNGNSSGSNKNGNSDIMASSLNSNKPQTNRGLRVYKIVILGDGGVGKSGELIVTIAAHFIHYHNLLI